MSCSLCSPSVDGRLTAEGALEHPYFAFAGGHNPVLEPVYGVQIDAPYEAVRPVEEWREMIFNELAAFQQARVAAAFAHHVAAQQALE